MALVQLAPDLWVEEGEDLRLLGMNVGLRMTIVRLPGGQLWLHSPVAATEARLQAVSALGEVAHLVGPNCYHHLYLGHWKAAFPDACLWGPAGLVAKRADLHFDGALEDVAPQAWGSVLDLQLMTRARILEEIWFCHRPSRTLVVTDLLQNHRLDKVGPVAGQLLRLNAMAGALPAMPRSLRLLVRRRPMRPALERVAGWDFDRLVLAHGEGLTAGAKGPVLAAMGMPA